MALENLLSENQSDNEETSSQSLTGCVASR